MDREIQIKQRIQERYDIIEGLYSAWFTRRSYLEVPKEQFDQTEDIEKHRAIAYLLDKGYIKFRLLEHEPGEVQLVELTITSLGIDYYEQGFLNGKANGWSVINERKDN